MTKLSLQLDQHPCLEPVAAPQQIRPATLIVDAPVRSGQSIQHPEGDVTLLKSVASGAEVIAGGSIHIYGTLRGRALAGVDGREGARIFCRRLQAEMVSIGGIYRMADEMDSRLLGKPVQAHLVNQQMIISSLE
jgi:septum site-determining protein MinC